MSEELRRLERLLEQRTAELRASEARFRNVIVRQGDGIVVTDRSGVVLFVNPAAEALFGRKAEELVGTLFGFPMIAGETTELDVVGARGAAVVAEMRVVETEWEGAEAFLLSLRDVTDRRRAAEERERRIREQVARVEAEAAGRRLAFLNEASALLAASMDPVAALPGIARLAVPAFADGCVFDLLAEDGSARRVQGWAAAPQADASGSLPAGLEAALAPPDAERLAALAAAGAERIENVEAHLAAAGGERLVQELARAGVVSLLRVPIAEHGTALGALTLVSRRGELRYGPDDLALAEDLAHRAALAIAAARLYHRVVESDRRKDEFLAMLAHELRNPLSPILSALEILRLRGAGADDGRLRAMQMVERQVKHMSRLVDDLLDVSRITRGKIELRREPVELATVVQRAVGTSLPLLEARRHRFELRLPAEPIWLEADTVRLEQVLVNLLNNAAKYTEPGGRVWLEAVRDGGEAVVRVRDDGIGMSREVLRSAFELFSQGERTLARTQGGLGIGLTLVRSLVEMHGGSVGAASDGPGRGSEFVLRLPLLAAPPQAPCEPAAGHLARGGPLRLLVVDDNVDGANSLGEVLRLWGYEVHVLYEGLGAVEAAQALQPEVVLLDIGLPGLDGYSIARQLRQSTELDGVLLAALTGYGQAEDQRRAREAGFDVHLTKPVDLVRLQRLIVEHRNGGAPA